MTDAELRLMGTQILIEKLGKVEAERYTALLLREPFDYTEWQQSLWSGVSAEDLSKKALEFVKSKQV